MSQEPKYTHFVEDYTQMVIDIVIANIGLIAIIYLCVSVTISAVWSIIPIGWDDTDGNNRSGLSLYTDCGTGVQYLNVSGSAPTVRLDKTGTPVVNFSSCH